MQRCKHQLGVFFPRFPSYISSCFFKTIIMFYWKCTSSCSTEPISAIYILVSFVTLPRGVRCYNSGSWLRGGVIYADPVIIIHRLVINGIITMIKTWPASAHKLIQITHINTHHRRAEPSTRGHAGCHLISDHWCLVINILSIVMERICIRHLTKKIFQNCNGKNKIFIQFIITT